MAFKPGKNQSVFHFPVRVVISLVITLAFFSPTIHGQGASSALNGTVKDPTGLPIVDARVSLTNLDTLTVLTTNTNEVGRYVFAGLTPARYSLSIEKQGFQSATVSSFVLAVDQTLTEDVQLAVGATAQQIEVQASEENVETTTTELGTAIQNTEVSGLPLNGRNFTQLLNLTGGTSPISTDQSSGLSSGSFGGRTIGSATFPAVSGQPNRSTLFLLDGFTNYGFIGTYAVEPIVDAIQEFKVQSHNDSSAYGGAMGGIVNVVTRAGTQEFHGDAWEFLRNQLLNARNYFATSVTPYRQNQFGGTIGGPVVPSHLLNGRPSKTFFFAAYEGFRSATSAHINEVVPTQAQLSGDLSSISVPIFDPSTTAPDPANPGYYTRQQYPNNQIPASEINQQVVAYAKKIYPTVTSLPVNGYNFTDPTLNIANSDTGTARIDHTFNDRLFVWGTFNKFDLHASSAVGIPGVTNAQDESGYLTGGSVTWTSRSGKSILDARFGRTEEYILLNYNFPAGLANAYQAGGFNSQTVSGFTGGLSFNPGMTIPGFTTLPEGFNQGNQLANIWETAGDYTRLMGKHTLQMGADINTNNNRQPILYVNETFDPYQTQYVDVPNPNIKSSGSALASFLLGLPLSANRRNLNVTTHGGWVDGFYFQDQWRAAAKLQVNLGFRYDVTLWPIYGSKKDGNAYVGDTDLDTGQYILQAVPPACYTGASPCIPTANGALPANVIVTPKGNGSIVHNTNDNWQPRIGISYQIMPKTVIRTGAGRFFDNWAGINQLATNYQGSWPDTSFLGVANLNGPLAPVTSAQNPFSLGTGTNIEPAANPFSQVNFFIDPFYKNAYAIEWNFGVQQQVRNSTLVEIDYVGSHTSRLDSNLVRNVGLYPAATALSTRQPFSYITPTQYDKSNSNANYSSMRATLRTQLNRELTLMAAYTWSKTIDLGCDGYFGGASSCSVQDPYHMNNDRSVAGFDIPQMASLSFIYELPFGHGKLLNIENPVLNEFVGNWNLSGIYTARSGVPYHGTAAAQISNTGNNFERPNRTCSNPYANSGGVQLLNTSCFSLPANYTFGTEPRNDLRSPHVTNLDTSMAKEFPLRESSSKQNVEFRADFFNTFNSAAFNSPADLNVADINTTFGVVTSTAQSERLIQLALKVNF